MKLNRLGERSVSVDSFHPDDQIPSKYFARKLAPQRNFRATGREFETHKHVLIPITQPMTLLH